MASDLYSNLAIIPFNLDGFIWHSAEHYYQASKFSDPIIIDKIKSCSNPYRCAVIGQTREFEIREDWEDVKISVMERAIRARFEQHLSLAEELKQSKGKLYDHTAEDDFWGPGFGDHDHSNMTGEILMKIRDELQAST